MSVEHQETFINNWLDRMSLRQKVGQMTMAERMHVTAADVKEHALGSVLSGGGSHPGANTPADWVRMNDEFWQASVADEDAPGIPILFGIDAVHGHGNVKGATVFPHNIGFGATGDPGLVAKMARVTAREILASGVEWNFAPTLAVVQNAQWGRTYESYGSDSALIGRIGAAYVKALQAEGVMGCVKHWVGDGGTRNGIDQGETSISYEELEAVHISPYYPSLKAGVLSVMVSFNSWNGHKCHGHHRLITRILKEKLRFDGIVLSDWDGIDYLHEDYGLAIRESVNAGIDMFMAPEKWRDFIAGLMAEVEAGQVSMSRIDDAVRRILVTKLRYGLFDMPRPKQRPGANDPAFGSEAHRSVAREAVRKSQVLLKHEQDVLPLEPGQRILVAGKSADHLGNQCGGWTLSWQGEASGDTITGTSIWEGIRQLAPAAVLSRDGSGAEADPDRHDIAVVVIGETPYAEGFGDIRAGDHLLVETGSMINGRMNPLEPYGRSMRLADIHPEDLACIERIRDAGVPVVALLLSGRPLVVDAELDAATAFVAGWLPGSEGLGIAEVLFGRYPFTGRLPMPWPGGEVAANFAANGDLPAEKFPAGYGLSVQDELVLTALSN